MNKNKEKRVGQRLFALIRLSCCGLFRYVCVNWYSLVVCLVIVGMFIWCLVAIVGDNVVEFTTGLLIEDK